MKPNGCQVNRQTTGNKAVRRAGGQAGGSQARKTFPHAVTFILLQHVVPRSECV